MATFTRTLTLNDTVINQTLQIYGSLDYIMDFIALNPTYTILDEIKAGETINVDGTFVKPKAIISVAPAVQTPITSIQGIYNQDIFDIIVRYYGSLDYIGQFISDNENVLTSITESSNGKVYNVNPNSTKNVLNFNTNNKIFATYIVIKRAFDKSFSFAFS